MKKIKDDVVYNGKVFVVNKKTFEREDGSTFERDIVETPEVVHILPIDEEGTLYTINEFRGSIEETTMGFPAGKVDEGETPEQSAIREVEEEIGMKVTDLFPINKNLVTTMGICDEIGHYYLGVVREFKEGERTNFPDSDENIQVVKYKPAEFAKILAEAIKNNKKVGLKTAFLWMMFTFYEKTLSGRK